MSDLPFASLIVPCYNEQEKIGFLLEAVYRQTYPLQRFELVLADGMSTDRTRDVIADFVQSHPDLQVRMIDNPEKNIPSGLNQAIAAARGEFIVRSDAHSTPHPEYIERNVAALLEGRGEIVGGIWEVRPGNSHWMARAIAVAGAHPLGVGDAFYRFTNKAQYVDTVPFGAFRRSLLQQVSLEKGPFDETLLTNEDYEFYTRVRLAGGRIWLDPAIRSVYFARSSLPDLAKQYWRYGYWKYRMLRRYPRTVRWRQFLPPLFVLSLLGLGILGFFLRIARWLLLGEAALYLFILLLAGIQAALRRRDTGLLVGLPLAIATMHLAWGGAFLWSGLSHVFKRK